MAEGFGHFDPCDSLYVAPHVDDVALSCPARILAEVGRGMTVAVVTVFGGAGETAAAADNLAARGVRHHCLGLPEAARRDPAYASFRALTRERQPTDELSLQAAVDALTDLAHRSRAREVYVPLGVGGHIDHRLCHEACLRSFESGDGRNVFLYEERPEAFVRGAVRIRLGHVGARLPPGAASAADRTSLAPFLFRFQIAPALRGDLKGFTDRVRSARVAASLWREARSWHPQRGFGPRLQPIVHAADAEAASAVRALAAVPSASAAGVPERLAKLSAAYARRLGGGAYAERYWLLLPHRLAGGLSTDSPDAATA